MSVSPFRQSDREEVLRIRDDAYAPARISRFLWQPCQQVESLDEDCAKLVFREECVKAYAAARRLDWGSFRLNLLVDPRHTRRGIGTRLLDEIEAEARRQGGRELEARLLEGMDGSLAFGLSRGFTELHRMRGMSLRAGDFSFERWRGLGEKLSAEGFTPTTLKDEADAGREPLEKLIELHRHAQEGWFQTNLVSVPCTSPEHLRGIFSHITVPERVSIIKHAGEYVGYTSAHRGNMLGTGVHPSYRGRGVATHMKALDLKRLIDDGVDYFESSSANPAMLKVNERLGYKPNGLAEVRLAKLLG
jgi:GNAT superfamily N-acetyltransferase